jgi:diacylglycerol kinase (ATP)
VIHPLGRPLVIANPAAGGGRNQVLPRLRAALHARGVEHDVALTEAPQHATELARAAVEDQGRTYLIVVGGDGTVHEAVNGMVDASAGTVRGDDPVLGVVGGGSGCDLLRTFGLDRRPEVLADHLATDDTQRIDLGRLRLHDRQGQPTTVVFANVAEAGFGGVVTDVANRLPDRLGAGRYAAAIFVAWGRFRRVGTHVRVDGGEQHESLSNVVIANAQFYGGGMHVAPRALPTDGRFNVQAWGGSATDVLRAGGQLRRGTHLARDDVREWQSERVEVRTDRPVVVEADGEVIGTTPIEADVLQHVLRFKV